MLQRVDGIDQLLLVKRRVGVVEDIDADVFDLAAAVGYRQEGAALLHGVDSAGDRPVVVKTEQVGALFP